MDAYGQTELHPLGLVLTLLAAVAMLTGRRERAVLAFLLVACLVTHAQRVVLVGLDFSMLRILILAGWARILLRGETSSYRFEPLDAVLPLWLLFGTLAHVFGPRASMDEFVRMLGVNLDAAGTYFLFRILLRDVKDVHRAIVAFGTVALVVAGPMLLESLTGRNVFSFLGGVAEETRIREGRFRCQASFSHPIMAGNFGASTAALLIGLVLGDVKQRLRHGVALLGAVLVTFLSNSAGPALALVGCLLGWCIWPYRRFMPLFLWGAAVALLVIHFIYEQSVWHLIGRISSIVGGTGWHRVALIDNFVSDFDRWWLFGMASTAHWTGTWTPSDITNQYILEGVRGGLPRLLSFVAMLVVAFRTVGRARARVRRRRGWSAARKRRRELLVWSVGAVVGVHAVAFIGVSYFGQLLPILYVHLAMVPALASAVEREDTGEECRRRVSKDAERGRRRAPTLGGDLLGAK